MGRLIMNEHKEFVDDYEPRKLMKLKPVNMGQIRADAARSRYALQQAHRSDEPPKCGWCGEPFSASKKHQRYCCKGCYEAARRARKRGEAACHGA